MCAICLPDRDRPKVLARIRGAWALTDAAKAEQELGRLADELERSWPDAGASLREGLPETLTLMRLGVTGKLAKTLRVDEPGRVDDRDRPLHPSQREALARRRHAQALDGRRDAPSRATVPADRRLQRPREARHSDRTTSPHRQEPRQRWGPIRATSAAGIRALRRPLPTFLRHNSQNAANLRGPGTTTASSIRETRRPRRV
jgi:hypothetical protein